MVTLQGFALIAELAAAIWLIVALAGFGISRAKPWLMGSAVAFVALIVAVTMLIESST
ncbi:MAG: hypothetical protein WA728_13880 [Xanthobacteraceae bacterium]